MALRTLVRPESGTVIEPGCYHVLRLSGPDREVAGKNCKALIGTSVRLDLPGGQYAFFRVEDACQSSVRNTIVMAGYTECSQRIHAMWDYVSDLSSARFGEKPAIPHQPLSA